MQAISNYLKDHQPHYQLATMRKIYDRIRALKRSPYIGRPGRIEGTREILFQPMPYIAVYRVHEQTIDVWRNWHAAQDRPRKTGAHRRSTCARL